MLQCTRQSAGELIGMHIGTCLHLQLAGMCLDYWNVQHVNRCLLCVNIL